MLTILQGDVIEQLRTLPDESVHCCVTSPPYWSLRDYSTEGQIGLEKTPDCGRPLAKLISELTSSQVAFVRQRLSDAGLLDAFPSGMGGITQQRSQSRSEVQDDHPTTSNDEPEGVRRASDNLGKSSRRASGQPSEIHDKQASCNPSLSPENVRLSNSDDEIRQDENYGADDSQHALRHDQSPVAMPDLVAYPTERDLSTSQLSSAHFPSSSETGDSQPLQDPKALREQQDSLPDYHGDSSKSSRKNYRKSKVRDRDTFFDIGDKLWAWYSLPQDVTRFYESQLCGECYVCKMVEVFREVRRVLRKDGTLWLNLGDSYANIGNNRTGEGEDHGKSTLALLSNMNTKGNWSPDKHTSVRSQRRTTGQFPGLKTKDLCGIPWRVAFALQADGWWLRSDIIWAKPNPMPESVTDRPTKAHEYLFLLTKSANYFYDAEAIKERASTVEDRPFGIIRDREWGYDSKEAELRGRKPHPKYSGSNGTSWQGHSGNLKSDGTPISDGSRNKRSVWTVATAPYPEAHFATYPPDLIKPCIMAGTSAKGCCAKCGSPWEGIVEREVVSVSDSPRYSGVSLRNDSEDGRTERSSKTIGWQPTCKCCSMHDDPRDCTNHPFGFFNQQTQPCTVLDPFAGSGTTGAVALELGRKAILIELNPKYVELIKTRCNVTPGLALA